MVYRNWYSMLFYFQFHVTSHSPSRLSFIITHIDTPISTRTTYKLFNLVIL